MTPRPNRLACAAAVVALAAGVAACGDDDDDADDASGSPAATAAPATTDAAPATDAPATDAPATTGAPDATDATATTAGAQEVTQTIQVGVAWADLEAFVAVNPAYGVGDPEQQALAVLDGWRRDGVLPVNGVDIEFVTAGYSAIDADQKLAVCQQFGNEGDIFAVIGGRDFSAGAECLATRFQIPVIDTNQAPASTMSQTAPYMFTLKPNDTEIATMFANWAVETGALEGKNVGIFWESQFAESTDAFKTIIGDAGVTIASEVESGGQGSVGSEQDQLAAQRFQSDGVDLVVFFVGSSGIVNFLQASADQGYAPEYLDTDWASHMSDIAAGAYNQEQWADTMALSSTAFELSDAAESCISSYEEFAGVTLGREQPAESGEFSNILITCDLASVLLEGIRNATADGGELTADSFIEGVQQIQDLPGAHWNSFSFGPDDHTGAATVVEAQYDTSCPCWREIGDWMPIEQFLS